MTHSSSVEQHALLEEFLLVGIKETAELCGVQPGTAYQWRSQGQLPAPDWTVSGSPIWRRERIEAWARETGRLV